jgi:serine/threonine protein kinase
MRLGPGTRLGPYEVLAQIGVGGMGEVYKATDTNLKRAVAIKVLPASVAADAERLAWFQRETEVLASLNHPNIAAIYGLERSGATTALVMRLVEGPTLADRIAEGAIPIEEAPPIAKQIAEALEAAHEQGIIHRDLKPANIKVRSDGTVKVLDLASRKRWIRRGFVAEPVDVADDHDARDDDGRRRAPRDGGGPSTPPVQASSTATSARDPLREILAPGRCERSTATVFFRARCTAPSIGGKAMSTNGLATMRLTVCRATVGLFAGLLAAGWYAGPRLAAAQPAPQGPRLYVFDCGYLINVSPETFNLTRQDVADPTASVPCFLVVHPNGALAARAERRPLLLSGGTDAQSHAGSRKNGGHTGIAREGRCPHQGERRAVVDRPRHRRFRQAEEITGLLRIAAIEPDGMCRTCACSPRYRGRKNDQ